MSDFLQDMYEIESSLEEKIVLNDKEFFKSVITLPTFNMTNLSNDIVIQISVDKQQYRTGVQPMLYINIPVNEFENYKCIVGKTSSEEKYGILRINKNKIDVIKNIFICFGMCSSSHHQDIIEILNIINNNI